MREKNNLPYEINKIFFQVYRMVRLEEETQFLIIEQFSIYLKNTVKLIFSSNKLNYYSGIKFI